MLRQIIQREDFKMKKRLVSGLLIGCMAISLVACNGKKSNGEQTTTTAKATVTTGSNATYDYFNTLMNRTTPEGMVEYKYADFITLGDYKGVKAEFDTSIKNVTDEDYQNNLKNVLSAYSTTNKVTSGTTKNGDKINLDFSGKLDGVAFDNGTATDQTYTVGSGQFISDLDKGLAGLTVGKEYSIPCKFPTDYDNKDLAGKDVVFDVTVNYIEETVYPELDDELVAKIVKEKELDDSIKTVADFEKNLKEALKNQAEANFKDAKFNAAWETVLANCTYAGTPQVDYDAAYNSMLTNIKSSYEQYSSILDWETFLKMSGFDSEEALKKYCEESASDYVKTKLAMMAIAEKEGLKVSDEEYKDCAQYYVDYYQYDSLEDLVAALGKEKDLFIEERYYEVIYYKVYDVVVDNAKEVNKKSE